MNKVESHIRRHFSHRDTRRNGYEKRGEGTMVVRWFPFRHTPYLTHASINILPGVFVHGVFRSDGLQ
jgi:hypothetical protein